MLTRRRFLAISAAVAGLPAAARGAEAFLWQGVALGARATIRLTHPEAPAITRRAMAEIERLETIFSLYQRQSALSRLNAVGHLDTPPFELLECLSMAGAVHAASGGLFDPTVQPLWTAHAEAAAAGHEPTPAELAAALSLTGWRRVGVDATAVTLSRGMALTLNGIAQGYIADRVAGLLEAEGLSDILIDTGELRAIGGSPDGGDWPVKLAQGGDVALRGRALATSAPLGTTFDGAGRNGHILHPGTGRPAEPRWLAVTVSAPSAALADALSTSACLMKVKDEITTLCESFPGAKLESAIPL